MRFPIQPTRRGLTLIEVIIVIVLTIVALALVVLMLPVARPHHHHDHELTCATRVNQIHKGLILFAVDHNGRFPVPTSLSAETAALTVQPGNSSASLFSYMIFETYYSPEVVLCPSEPSPNVNVKTDYRYGTPDDTDWNSAWKWDPSFSGDITTPGANVSYVTQAILGERVKTQWRDSLDPDFAVAGDRGPKDGIWDAKSLTLLSHGRRDDWTGNVGFNDGSVRSMTFTKKDKAPFTVNGDNLFFADDGEMGGDMWLGLFGATDETTTTPYWD